MAIPVLCFLVSFVIFSVVFSAHFCTHTLQELVFLNNKSLAIRNAAALVESKARSWVDILTLQNMSERLGDNKLTNKTQQQQLVLRAFEQCTWMRVLLCSPQRASAIGAENVGKHETAHRLEPMSYNESTQVIFRAHANLYQHKDDIIVFKRTLLWLFVQTSPALSFKGLELHDGLTI